MTAAEARKILLNWMRGSISEDCPLIWVSEPQEEDETDYIFNATTYAPGEKPEAEAIPIAVNKLTGNVEMRVLLY